ncbi:MAG: aromatic amino acid ammonia-lyase [Pseudomonadota bacterium]
MAQTLHLDGASLTIEALVEASLGQTQISLDRKALQRMQNSRRVIDEAVTARKPVYGVTTGLGTKVTEALNEDDLATFSLQTIRGRAHAIGEPASRENVRAAMIVRANTLLTGHAGAQPKIAQMLVDCINANITPVTGSIGSVGVADLLPNATMALALIGEGEMFEADGTRGSAQEVLAKHGISPLELGPRDGLALASHSAMTAGAAALALHAAQDAYETVQSAAAMSMEGFRANLDAIAKNAIAAKPLPGQMEAASDLRKKLKGSALFDRQNARRLQDPLSIRNTPQIHGALVNALSHLAKIVEIEINSTSDNPIILEDQADIVSCGHYYTAELCHAVQSASNAFVQIASAQIARTAKHLNPILSDLPASLAKDSSASTGLAPLMKITEALAADLMQAAQPVSLWTSAHPSGVEDCISPAPLAINRLSQIAKLSKQMSTVELIVACQALDMRKPAPKTGAFIKALRNRVRAHVPTISEDRSLSLEIMSLIEEVNLFKSFSWRLDD